MTKTTIGPLDSLQVNDRFRVTFHYSGAMFEFALTDAAVREALEGAGFNVYETDADVLPGFRKIIAEIRVTTAGTANSIGRTMADAINAFFTVLWEVTPEKYELVTADLFGPPSTNTTVSLAALAILAGVGFYFFRRI